MTVFLPIPAIRDAKIKRVSSGRGCSCYHWLALGRIREQRDRERGRDDRGRGR
jgi:hypothetical protein